MSRLKRQLARLGGPLPAPVANPGVALPTPTDDARQQRLQALRARLVQFYGRDKNHVPSPPTAWRHAPKEDIAALPGAWESTAQGGLHMVRTRYAATHCHGMAPLASSLTATAAHMTTLALDGTFASVDPARLLYLDTETTGLAGGAGTLPFLIGMGRFVEGVWHLEQMFLRRLGEEAPMLHYLAALMRQASAIVTYNGKSFDWPLLRTRFVMNRIPVPDALPHLDLLHCTRRLLPQLAGGARLCQVERTLLAFERIDDVDGARIPALYFEFLRGGRVSPMAQVVTHNAHDLAALAAILGAFVTRLDANSPHTPTAGECLAVARLYERQGDAQQAHTWAQRAVSHGAPHPAVVEGYLLRARLHQQAGAFDAAVACWNAGLDAPALDPRVRSDIHLALAKVYEHRLVNYAQAQKHAPHTAIAEGHDAMTRRIQRLQRKCDRAREALSAP